MELREKLELNNARIVDLTKYPKNPEPSRVLVIEAPLTLAIADMLKCRMMAYNIHDQPNIFEGGFGLKHELVDVEVKLGCKNGSFISLFPKVVKKFRVQHNAKDQLVLTLRLHFSGYGDALEEWSDDVNDSEFEFQMLSTQGSLFDQPVGDGAAGGTRVDMQSGKVAGETEDADTGCVSCKNGIPFEDKERLRHSTGEACTRGGDGGSATLASAREAGVGTHQKKRQQLRQPRPEDDQAIADAEAAEAAEREAMPVN